MGIPQYTRLRTYNADGEFERDQVELVVRGLQDIPLINGALLKSIPLVVGDKTISHGLGRPLVGWVITRMVAPVFYPLSGTIPPHSGGTSLTGSSTKFESELVVGDRVVIRPSSTAPKESRTVTAITSDTYLTVSAPGFSGSASGDSTPEKHLPISIYENLATNSRPGITFTLNSSVALTADIWVF